MTCTFWTRKEIALIAVFVTLAFAAVFLSVRLSRQKPFPSADLGVEWQCNKTLFLTTCTKTLHVEPVLDSLRKNQMCLRRA
jgi:hypothetical protein